MAPSDVRQQLLEVIHRTADIAMKTGKMSPERRKDFILSGKYRPWYTGEGNMSQLILR